MKNLSGFLFLKKIISAHRISVSRTPRDPKLKSKASESFKAMDVRLGESSVNRVLACPAKCPEFSTSAGMEQSP